MGELLNPTGIGMKQEKMSIFFDIYLWFYFRILHTYNYISLVLNIKEHKISLRCIESNSQIFSVMAGGIIWIIEFTDDKDVRQSLFTLPSQLHL